MTTQRRCALYGRVSTARQAAIEDGGLDTQFSSMRRFIDYENSKVDQKWIVEGEYREEGFSGKNLERPAFRQMMKDIEAEKINTVLVYKIDRITRSMRDFYQLWEVFEKQGVQFISLQEKFDTTTAMGRAMLKFVLVFAELEREQTAERTAATMRHRAEQGLWNGGRILGYDLDPEQKGHLKVNSEQARIVREDIFKKCVELGSAGKVLRHLQSMGLKMPVYESRSGIQHGGGPYTKPTVIRVLINPAYLGLIEHNGERFQGRHEPIVDEDLFNRVQEILDENRERHGNYRDQVKHVFLLQGLLRCGQCGSAMTPKTCTGRGGKLHHYYQCVKDAKTMGAECQAKYIPAEGAEEYVLTELEKLSLSREEIDNVVREANLQKDTRLEQLTRERKAYQEQLREIRGRIQRIVEIIEEGGEFRSFGARLSELEQEQAELEEQLADIRSREDQILQDTLSMEVMAATYEGFPEILARLRDGEEWQAIKELIGCYLEVIEWHQNPEDPSAGEVKMMLFEQALPCELVGASENPDVVHRTGASGCNGRLPESTTLRTTPLLS